MAEGALDLTGVPVFMDIPEDTAKLTTEQDHATGNVIYTIVPRGVYPNEN